jgi:tryptophan synthase alpha chain
MNSMVEASLTGRQKIAGAFTAAREEGRTALMPYLMGGFPDAETSLAVARAYADAGADLIELGVPFSDPLADGPVIHAAATRALAAGATLEGVLSVCEQLAGRLPVVPMVYANMVLARGPSEFARLLADAGAAGVIVPDLPLEEAGEIREELRGGGVALVPLVAPTAPDDRRQRICERAEGFVYVVSDTRVTGERDGLPDGLAELVSAVRAEASVPAAVGFGIGTPEQVAAVGRIADGVIVGSRLVRAVSEAGGAGPAVDAVSEFIRAARQATSDRGRLVE